MSHFIVAASGERFPLHECSVVSDDGRTVADFRENGWFSTRDFYEAWPAYLPEADVLSLRPVTVDGVEQ